MTTVASTRIGFRGLLDTSDSITECLIVPGITLVFQSLVWTTTCGETQEETDLLRNAAQLHKEANDAMRLAGELSAKLDLNEQSTSEIGKFIAATLELTFLYKKRRLTLSKFGEFSL
ncbi:unnamed protein product [Rodentolepis nana]|uniref:HisKA domain-containing protein n=1 Tax=Rodentolepis nana TaxID=102285 RepID=A0A0R3TKB1_RODNA|nr:unnamed protein product [Rodentolepis nana]